MDGAICAPKFQYMLGQRSHPSWASWPWPRRYCTPSLRGGKHEARSWVSSEMPDQRQGMPMQSASGLCSPSSNAPSVLPIK